MYSRWGRLWINKSAGNALSTLIIFTFSYIHTPFSIDNMIMFNPSSTNIMTVYALASDVARQSAGTLLSVSNVNILVFIGVNLNYFRCLQKIWETVGNSNMFWCLQGKLCTKRVDDFCICFIHLQTIPLFYESWKNFVPVPSVTLCSVNSKMLHSCSS